MLTFLSREAVKKYLSSCDQAHDQMIRLCAVLDLFVPDIFVKSGSESNQSR